MNTNNTIRVTFSVVENGDKFAVPGWPFRTRNEWARVSAMRTEGPERDIASAMVEYIDALPENAPQGYGFLGTLDVGGEEYDVTREPDGDYAALSRTRGEFLTFPSGRYWTEDWSAVLAAGKFTPRSDA